jgi:hypothetical protein
MDTKPRFRLTVAQIERLLGSRVTKLESGTRHSAERLRNTVQRVMALADHHDSSVLRKLGAAIQWQLNAVESPEYAELMIECRNGCLSSLCRDITGESQRTGGHRTRIGRGR